MVVIKDDQGRNCILFFRGANQDIDESYIDAAIASFGTGDYLVLQNEIALVPEVVKKAKQRGLFIIMNPSPKSPEYSV